MLGEKRGRCFTGSDGRVRDEPAQQAEVRRDASDPRGAERRPERLEGLTARLPVRDELGHERVVGHGDVVARLDSRVDADGLR